jgi:hypothetical protein
MMMTGEDLLRFKGIGGRDDIDTYSKRYPEGWSMKKVEKRGRSSFPKQGMSEDVRRDCAMVATAASRLQK